MTWTADGEILRLSMPNIDAGLEEPLDDPNPNIGSEEVRLRRAVLFRDWLITKGALPEDLREYVCFVDYTVFQDAKIEHPYFFLVSPTRETRDQYTAAVERLVGRTNEDRDCYSIAYHPEFVGIMTPRGGAREVSVIKVGEAKGSATVAPEAARAIEGKSWEPSFYLLWGGDEKNWPPTTRRDLVRLCGKYSLQECLERFQGILGEMRDNITDSAGRALTHVYCLPFLLPRRSPKQVTSDLPFSEIAAALFLGVSFEGTKEQERLVWEFVRTLALMTYRVSGAKKAEQTGAAEGLRLAIESFAHQVKAVANAMSMKWSVSLETWEEIQRDLPNHYPDAPAHLRAARVLPAPQLIEAIRDTLVLWSQTRKVDDLYDPLPTCFRDVIYRAWHFTSRIRFAQDNVSRNLGELVEDIIKIWEQDSLIKLPEITGEVDVPWGDLEQIDLESQSRLCTVTRLLVAIFDNAMEHGVACDTPDVKVKFDAATGTMSLQVSNVTGDRLTDNYSRLRVGMKGNDVLTYLAEQLGTKFTAPHPAPKPGEKYILRIDIPSMGIFFPSPRAV